MLTLSMDKNERCQCLGPLAAYLFVLANLVGKNGDLLLDRVDGLQLGNLDLHLSLGKIVDPCESSIHVVVSFVVGWQGNYIKA